MITLATLTLSFALSGDPHPAPPPPTQPAGAAHPGAPVPAAPDTSPLVHEGIVDAPVAKVWECFTTDEGFKNLGVAQARIDFRVGGKMLSHYDPKGTLGDPKGIENTIIAYEPERMVSFRISRPPDTFPFPHAWQSSWSVVTLQPVGPDRTRLRMVMLGYTADPESQKMRAFFDKGNAYVLKLLQERLGTAETRRRSERAWAIVRSLVGGTWRACGETSEGGKVCAATRWALGPGERSVVFTSELGEAGSALSPHVHMVIAPEPASDAVAFTAVNERGDIARGNVSLIDDGAVALDWNAEQAGGETRFRYITFATAGPDGFTQRVYLSREDAQKANPYVELTFKRAGADADQPAVGAASPAKPQSRGSDPMPLLRGLVGGTWIGEMANPKGTPVLGRVAWEPGVSNGFLVANGFLGAEGILAPHSLLICGVDPSSGRVRFWNFGDSGDIADGEVWAERAQDPEGDDRLVFGWNQRSRGADGPRTTAYHIVFAFDSPDAYHGLMYASAEDEARGRKPFLDMPYRRVSVVPDRFGVFRPPGFGDVPGGGAASK